MPNFRPTASLPTLQLRAQLLRRLRAFFDDRDFCEVETPLLSADTVIDRHIDPLAVDLVAGIPSHGKRLWLQTSPEFAMKRLLAAGAQAIYQITKAFRAGERGRWHNPEFTIVEWYRTGDDYSAGMQFLSDLAEALLAHGPAERLTYRDAFRRYVGLDPHTATLDEIQQAVREHGVKPPESLPLSDRDSWLELLLVERIEGHLGVARPTILCDYPASQAALARTRDDHGVQVAERFELYDSGVELANGYHELLDPNVLRDRNRINNRLRQADGKLALPEESRLLAAMEFGLPPSTGAALGFDRLVMLVAGADTLDEVLAFPIERA